jgi:type VI secretion system protein VasG
VGYGEGGVLTEAVRRKPYSVVLLDEVEKAHSDVHELFFQVFDKGWMEDGEGRQIDFKNTLILLTTNAGTELIASMCKDPELMPDPEGMAKALREPLLKVFPPALLGRLVAIPYYPLSDEMLAPSSSCSWAASRSGSRRATRSRSPTPTTSSSWWCRAAPRASRAAA